MSDRSHARDDAATWEQLLDAWRPLPAVIIDRRLNVLAATDVAQSLSGAFQIGANLARFTFLTPEGQPSHPRWKEAASATVGLLRSFVDEHDEDRASQHILGELATASRDFSEIWADPETRTPMTGTIAFEGTPVGTVTCTYSVLGVSGHDDCAVLVFTPSDATERAAVDLLAASSSLSS
ncbi:hypothetical protein HQQ85_06765 [Herbiconiux sp. VKM Ac-2851]|nr:hypothetical protein [Herbiconiux sp. VKM Ac-2851]NQX34486.1 hypothetical protein [Herbiconiux sp. VKM Ac-2851]